VVRQCEEGLFLHTVYELLAYLSLFFLGKICLYFIPLVWGSLSTKGEGVHRSHCAGIV
jgi:hypothetical protein